MKKAVLTADIKDSTEMSSVTLQEVNERLKAELKSMSAEDIVEYYELYRGDSAQAIVRKPSLALHSAFRIRTAINRIIPVKPVAKRGQRIARDIRIAIGIGETKPGKMDKMTSDEPFVYSGKGLDTITENGLHIGVFTSEEAINRELAVELFLMEGIQSHWTLSAAEVIYQKLLGKTERKIAGELGISQSAVNQHSRAAYWNGLEKLLERYRELTGEYDDHS